MTTIELTINAAGIYRTWQFQGPGSWSELSPAQAVVCVRFRERINENPAILFPLLRLLYKVKKKQQRWLFDERFLRQKGLSEADRQRALDYGQALIDSLAWVGGTEPGVSFLVPCFRLHDFQYGSMRVLMGRIEHRRWYYAPAESFSSSSFGEFMHADKAYQSGNYPLLAAILYRPGRSDKGGLRRGSDVRVDFDTETVDHRAALFARLDQALLQLIATQFAVCMQQLQQIFPRVFVQPVADATNEAESDSTAVKKPTSQGQSSPGQSSRGQSSQGWLDVAIGLAKLDVTKIAQIEAVNIYLALKVLDEQIRQADQLEQQMDAIRTN